METKAQGSVAKRTLYEEVATRIGGLIEQGTYRPGDRIPSIRDLSRRMNVSVNTVMEAYASLENRGVVEARPQSGFYVRSRLPEPVADGPRGQAGEEPVACCVSLDEVPLRIMRTMADPSHVPLGGERFRIPTCCRSTS